MNIVIFDTETTSLNKPFCYNIGYCIMNVESRKTLVERDFVVEQVWHNLPLFSTAYYADKRPIYVEAMRKHETIMDKYGYICQTMRRDFKKYEVESAYAYNSPFDDKVFAYNCDWFKCNNPFDTIPIYDIRGYAHNFIVGEDYIKFCEENSLFTETGNYSTTAENMYRFLWNDMNFIEAHTALADSRIEAEILFECFNLGAEVGVNYEVKRTIERKTTKTLEVIDKEKTSHYFEYEKIRINGAKTKIILK